MKRGGPHGSALENLTQWRNALLDRARSQYAQRAATDRERTDEVARHEATVENARGCIREQQISGERLSIESLLRAQAYATTVSARLKSAHVELQQSRTDLELARQAVKHKLEELAVVQRLRERRGVEELRRTQRSEQRNLDEHALLRVSADASRRQTSWEDDNGN